ncbi:hypothetical protein CBR_g23338 [Chara braunii]|uniref:Uncharacterized protein n=1 Tax=Chara braunii TaxID=69332 RepID=A0A388L441_CHABU|nr:hypothetical protein CBR_g23338 [Chara braunii]|eukprot:GBG77008.1 hypothetical protein CBR_g23338 [Chara braunii]
MNKFWAKLFRRRKQDKSALSANTASREKLTETLALLEKKDAVIQGKIRNELEKARVFMQQNRRPAALQCLKKKKMWEAQAENIANYQLRLHDQLIMLENATATTDVIDVLREGAQVMKQIQRQNNIDDVEGTMDRIREQSETMHQIQESLGAPVLTADLDEDDLERELQELEEMSEFDVEDSNMTAEPHMIRHPPAVSTASLARVSPQSDPPSGMRTSSHGAIFSATPGPPAYMPVKAPTTEEEHMYEVISDMAPTQPTQKEDEVISDLASTPPMRQALQGTT